MATIRKIHAHMSAGNPKPRKMPPVFALEKQKMEKVIKNNNNNNNNNNNDQNNNDVIVIEDVEMNDCITDNHSKIKMEKQSEVVDKPGEKHSEISGAADPTTQVAIFPATHVPPNQKKAPTPIISITPPRNTSIRLKNNDKNNNNNNNDKTIDFKGRQQKVAIKRARDSGPTRPFQLIG